MKFPIGLLVLTIATSCVKTAPLTRFPTVEAPAPDIAAITPAARAAFEKELPSDIELTHFAPTGEWEFARNPNSGIVTSRSVTAWIGFQRGTECYVSEVPMYQEQVGDEWMTVKVPLILAGLSCKAACSELFASMGILPANVEVDIDYFARGMGRAARVPCDA